MLRAIPCVLMRGGTSRGAFFHASDLPQDRDTLAEVLIAALGAGHPLQIDGLGGGAMVTSKVAIAAPSGDRRADIDYLFAQVLVEKRQVDFSPTCGNMLAGVAPFAIEAGLVAARDGETPVRIRSVNTRALIEAVVQTPNGRVTYEGNTRIDGVPGTAAPILLNFMDVIGSKTGALFPTGRQLDRFEGIEVTCIDVAMPMVIARAADFGLTGHESSDELNADAGFFARMEAIRRQAGAAMGLGDVAASVVPKFAVIAPPRDLGTITSRYLVPDRCHPTHAVSGAICVGSCALAEGTVAEGIARMVEGTDVPVRIDHPSGSIEVRFRGRFERGRPLTIERAGIVRTARKLMGGNIYVPGSVVPRPARLRKAARRNAPITQSELQVV
jgi:2-methylaconitate cis-trans-isomerase PrpF